MSVSDEDAVRVMLGLEHLAGQAARNRDFFLLGACAEAWERRWGLWALIDAVTSAGWEGHGKPPRWSHDDAERWIRQARYAKNRAKLRHLADALWVVLPAVPLGQADWMRAKYARLEDC